jgi:hypothetical protein
LTGDMISAYSEMNQLLGRTKGKLPPASWAELADELVRCTDLYTSAWSAYLYHVDSDPELRLERGRDATRAFQAAVDGLRTALDTLRRDASLINIVSWPHHDD